MVCQGAPATAKGAWKAATSKAGPKVAARLVLEVHVGCANPSGNRNLAQPFLPLLSQEPALALAAGEVVYHLAQDLGAHFISLHRLLHEHPRLIAVATEVVVTFVNTLACGLFLDSQVREQRRLQRRGERAAISCKGGSTLGLSLPLAHHIQRAEQTSLSPPNRPKP
jgi:hypothetical protein